MQVEALQQLVEQGLNEIGYSDIYLVELKITSNKIEIFLDSDEGITFLKCQKLSRWLEAIFDEKQYFGPSYTLEVSSSGVGSPLKQLRQYAKNIGRSIDIRHRPDKKSKGLLKEVNGNIIVVEYEDKIKEGKKNKKIIVRDEIKFEDIIESRIKVSFN